MLDELSYCQTKVSAIVEASVEEVWRVVRDWGRMPWLEKVDNKPLDVSLIDGSSCSVGSTRQIKLGHSLFFERLVAMDDEKRSMKWRLVSHPDSVSPFPEASFINFCSSLVLKEVTQGSVTYAEWKGNFYTEHNHMEEMHRAVEHWFQTALLSLQAYISAQRRSKATQERAAEYAGQERGPATSQAGQPQPSGQSQHTPFTQQASQQQYHSQPMRQRQHSGVSNSSTDSRPDGSPISIDITEGMQRSSLEQEPGPQVRVPKSTPGSFPQRPSGTQLLSRQGSRPMGALPVQYGVPVMPNRQAEILASRGFTVPPTHMGQEIPGWAKAPNIGVGGGGGGGTYPHDLQRWPRVPSPTLGQDAGLRSANQWPGGLGGGQERQQQRPPQSPPQPAWPPSHPQNPNGWARQ